MNSPEPDERALESPEADLGTPHDLIFHPQESAESGLPGLTMRAPDGLPPVDSGRLRDSGSPLRWPDLIYLLLFYVVAGELLGLVVAAVAAVAFHIPFSQLQDM